MAKASVVGVMGGSGGVALGNNSLMVSPTTDEMREIHEYEKLLRFRDDVVSGAHPRIKPSHLPGRAAQSQSQSQTQRQGQGQSQKQKQKQAHPPASAPTQPAAARKGVKQGGRPVIDNFQSHQANKRRPQVNMGLTQPPGLGPLPGTSAHARPPAPAKPEINPVLLEKSADLIKAEIHLQRQRVERSLKEQLEQRRAANKASEQLAELDVADVLAKAMSLLHATPPGQSTDDAAANASAPTDSADDDTFYSSRHDTPESNMVSRLPNESEDEEMRDGSPYEPELDFEPLAQGPIQPAQAIPGVAPLRPQQQLNTPAVSQPAPAAAVTVPGLSIGAGSSTRVYQSRAPEASNVAQSSSGSRSEESGNTGSARLSGARDLARVNERLLNQELPREPRLVRGHDLSPLAPQPTHVLPPASAREQQLVSAEPNVGPQAAPAQVTALRGQPSNGSSPESSSYASKAAEKKARRKKRKADRLAAEAAAASPYIKPEPRSPSPLTPQYARPNKRQRYSQQQPLEIPDDEPRFEQPAVVGSYQQGYQPRVVRQERVVGYERADDYRSRHGDEPILVASPRYERVYYDDYRAPPPSGFAAGPEPQYVAREVRTVRPPSRIVEAPFEDGATYYRAASRMSVRPAAYPERSQSPVGYERPPAAMPPPRAPPRRIIIDAFGREYLEPVRSATVVREDAVADPRAQYEQILPPRAVSRRPEPFDDSALLYRPTSPTYPPPRRVITQPEYIYREPAGPGNPMPPPPAGGEYLPSRPELPREYISRPASTRPPLDQQYDMLPAYERVHVDDRPPPPRDYYRAASARPTDGGRVYELPVAYERRLAPDEYPPPQRPASVRPAAAAEPTPQQQQPRYDLPPREYAPPGTARRVEYATTANPSSVYHLPPQQSPGNRAYSVVPGGGSEGRVVGREYAAPGAGPAAAAASGQQQQMGERYYGRAPQQQQEEEVVFLERPPQGYR